MGTLPRKSVHCAIKGVPPEAWEFYDTSCYTLCCQAYQDLQSTKVAPLAPAKAAPMNFPVGGTAGSANGQWGAPVVADALIQRYVGGAWALRKQQNATVQWLETAMKDSSPAVL